MAQCHSIMSPKLYLASKSLLILPHLPLDLSTLQTLYFSLRQFNTQETPPATNIPFISVPHPRQGQHGARNHEAKGTLWAQTESSRSGFA